MTSSFTPPEPLAVEMLDHLGVGSVENWDESSLTALGQAASSVIPAGSLAKLAAEGTPPGSDPEEMAERILGGEHLSWSCHSFSTLIAALIASTQQPGLRADVALAHRRDEAAPPVDLHSVVVVDIGEVFVLDAYHACPSVPLRYGETRTTSTR